MRRIREVLRLKFNLGLNDSQVASGAGIARTTVQDYLRRIAATGLDHEQLLALGDEALDQRLFPPRGQRETGRPLPDSQAFSTGAALTVRYLAGSVRRRRSSSRTGFQVLSPATAVSSRATSCARRLATFSRAKLRWVSPPLSAPTRNDFGL